MVLRGQEMNPWLIAGLLGSILLTGTAGFRLGKGYTENQYKEAQQDQLEKDSKTVEKLRLVDKQKEVIYLDRVKIVREAVDNCLDQSISGPGLEQLRESTGTPARPKTDGRLPPAKADG